MMRVRPDRRDILLFLVVSAACVLFILGGVVAAYSASHYLLQRDAEATAAIWAKYVAQNIDLNGLLAGNTISANNQMYFDQAREAGHVFLYKIFNSGGLLIHKADYRDKKIVPIERENLGSLLLEIVAEGSHVQIKTDSLSSNTRYFAEVYFPLIYNGSIKGFVSLYIDQTERAQLFRHTFHFFSAALAILMAIAAGLPLHIVWKKLRQRREAEMRIRFLAHHDPMTGLPNRLQFNEKLREALIRAKGDGTCVGLLYVDVDCFKDVNDGLGHAAGDVLLCDMARRASSVVRDVDIVARLGGDEFAVIQLGISERADATELAAKICRHLTGVYDISGHVVASSVSVGVAIGPKDGADANRLLKSADLALYRAKATGRSSYCLFEPWMDTRLHVRRQLEHELRDALSTEQFELYYQPQFDLLSGDLSGFEALLRWHRADGVVVPPNEFIPVAEETGLIVSIGAWALRDACLEAMAWPWPGSVAVNLSPAQFWSCDVISLVKEATLGLGFPPERLELEITENLLLSNTESVKHAIHKIKDLGVKITMDDFGSGYSNLSYIWKFPFDKIKIDQVFVQNLENGRYIAAIIDAIFSIGHSLEITVAAEGVETIEQANFLKDRGCQQVQGYLFGRPLPARETRAIITRATAYTRASIRQGAQVSNRACPTMLRMENPQSA